MPISCNHKTPMVMGHLWVCYNISYPYGVVEPAMHVFSYTQYHGSSKDSAQKIIVLEHIAQFLGTNIYLKPMST